MLSLHIVLHQAPESLLPNYGDGRLRQYTMDINMMTLLNSKERSLEDFIQLGNSAGLDFVKLWETGEMGLVEFTLCDDTSTNVQIPQS